MLKEWVKDERPSDEELSERLEKARAELAVRQMKVKEAGLPVLVVFDGWGAAGKGSVLGRVIKNMDPRFFKCETLTEPTSEELRRPFLYRYFVRIPKEGKFSFFDGSWMGEVTSQYLQGDISKSRYKSRLTSIKRFERQLNDNGYLELIYNPYNTPLWHYSKSLDDVKKHFTMGVQGLKTENQWSEAVIHIKNDGMAYLNNIYNDIYLVEMKTGTIYPIKSLIAPGEEVNITIRFPETEEPEVALRGKYGKIAKDDTIKITKEMIGSN